MKKSIVTLFSLFCVTVSAQDNVIKPKHNFVYFSPVDLFYNTLELGYERSLKNHDAIAITGGFKLDKTSTAVNRVGGTGEIQYRVNLMYTENARITIIRPYSVFPYFAPYLSARYEKINNPAIINDAQTTTTVRSVFGGVGFGFRITGINNRFTLNAFAGGGLKYADIDGDTKYDNFFEVGYNGFAPKLALQMGITF